MTDGDRPQVTWSLIDLRQGVAAYGRYLEGAGREPLTVHTYKDQSARFVRWLAGEYRPRNLSSAMPPRSIGHGWTAKDLRVDHSIYGQMLDQARLKPLAVQTYMQCTGAFLTWITRAEPEPPEARPQGIEIAAPTEKQIDTVTKRDDDWLWEGNVQRVLRDWLAAEGWKVLSEADPAIREHGIDLVLERGSRQLAIEVKGYPQTTMRRGANKGKPRKYHPAAQAGQHFAGALQSALRMRDARPDSEIALGLPDTSRYRDLVEKSVRSLQDLGIGVFLVREDGTVHPEISTKRR